MDKLRLALTMRCTKAERYGEHRDSLASEWAPFLTRALNGVSWLPVPNIEKDAPSMLKMWGVNAVLLTGGDDIGRCHRRDCTEFAILETAIEHKWPVFGICRGLQLLHYYFGGTLVPCQGHVATYHPVYIQDGLSGHRTETREVNSYHNWRIPDIAPGMRALAYDMQGGVEAAIHESLPIAGVLWHPEREKEPNIFDKEMVREFFGGFII